MDVPTDRLANLVALARQIDAPHVDLAPILGLSGALSVGVDDLAEHVLAHDLPTVSIRIDETRLVISRIEGGAMLTVEGVF